MPKPLAAASEALRQSLWLIPAIAVLAAAVAAEGMVWLSGQVETPEWLRAVFAGGATAAQALLQAITTSVITVAGVTFSVTIIALQLTSTQFSPRVLRNFLRDRYSQSVLAIFLATFVYSLLVLAKVRVAGQGQDALVPIPAVAVAILLTLISIGMLAYFIHHIAHTIQVSAITESVSREARATVRREWREADDDPGDIGPPARSSDDESVMRARESGYLAYVSRDSLVKIAAEADAAFRVAIAPGEWVSEGRPLVTVTPADAQGRLRKDPRDGIELGPQPTLQQDIAFGVRQLVDIALKALSPSLNDPSTAVNCIHRITELLLLAGRRWEPPSTHRDDSGALRLVTPQHDFNDLVGLAFDQIRGFGGERLYVALAIVEALQVLLDDLPERRHAPVRREARLLARGAERIEPEEDRRTVMAQLDRLIG